MKISIALATYNGAKYLREQLESFLIQTRQPDELVACDDGSTDGTVKILEEFQAKAPFKVNIHRNEINLGVARNFCKAMQLCEGDLVLLSDQDDVWFEEKIKRIKEIATTKIPHYQVYINDFEFTDAELNPTGITGNSISISGSIKGGIKGCTTAVSKDFVDLACPIPHRFIKEGKNHDNWIHWLAKLFSTRFVVDEVLQYYRRHDSNNSSSVLGEGPRKVPIQDKIRYFFSKDTRKALRKRLTLIDIILDFLKGGEQKYNSFSNFKERIREVRKDLRMERAATKKRMTILSRSRLRRFYPAIKLYYNGGYSEFRGWMSLLKDIIKRYPDT